jgi:hypothetical protein
MCIRPTSIHISCNGVSSSSSIPKSRLSHDMVRQLYNMNLSLDLQPTPEISLSLPPLPSSPRPKSSTIQHELDTAKALLISPSTQKRLFSVGNASKIPEYLQLKKELYALQWRLDSWFGGRTGNEVFVVFRVKVENWVAELNGHPAGVVM